MKNLLLILKNDIVSSHDEQFFFIQPYATNVPHATVPTEPPNEFDFKLYCLNHLLNILL